MNPPLLSHCPAHQNPADLPTRAINPVLLQNRAEWLRGPNWLEGDIPEGPSERATKEIPENCIAELKADSSSSNIALFVQANA